MSEQQIKMTVYLCGSIAGCSDEECKGWRNEAAKALPDVKFLDPMRRDYRSLDSSGIHDAFTPKIAREIVENDKADVLASDAILVYYDRPSTGTAMEVLYAYDNGIYVLTVDASKTPLSPWMVYHSDKVVKTLDEAYTTLKDLSENFGEYYTVNELEDEE